MKIFLSSSLICTFILSLVFLRSVSSGVTRPPSAPYENHVDFAELSGEEAYQTGTYLVQNKKFGEAAHAFWVATLKGGSSFTVSELQLSLF
jgi:hypothetical protein